MFTHLKNRIVHTDTLQATQAHGGGAVGAIAGGVSVWTILWRLPTGCLIASGIEQPKAK